MSRGITVDEFLAQSRRVSPSTLTARKDGKLAAAGRDATGRLRVFTLRLNGGNIQPPEARPATAVVVTICRVSR